MAHQRKTTEERGPVTSVPVVAAGTDEDEVLRHEIELRAYYRYCERGCAPGADLGDWLATEQDVLAARAERLASPVTASAEPEPEPT